MPSNDDTDGEESFLPYIYDDGGYYKTEIECVKCDIRYFDAEDPVKFSEWYALYNAKKTCPHCGGELLESREWIDPNDEDYSEERLTKGE